MCTDPCIASVLKAKTRHPDFGQFKPFDTVEIRASGLSKWRGGEQRFYVKLRLYLQ